MSIEGNLINLGKPLKSIENELRSTKIDEDRRRSTKIYEKLRKSMHMHVNAMQIHGNLRKSTTM